jgi:protein SCO1/2
MFSWSRIAPFRPSAFLRKFLNSRKVGQASACAGLKPRHHLPVLGFVFLALAACASKPPLPEFGTVPAFELTCDNGKLFGSATQLTGKVWIADFIFTNCPGPCPRMTQHMKRIQDQSAGIDDLKLISFTVDPERDSPEVLAAYGKRFGADPQRWYFLTGPRESLHHLSKEVFKLGDVAPDLEHSTRFVLVDKKSRIRGYYSTTEPSFIAKLLEDAKALVKE